MPAEAQGASKDADLEAASLKQFKLPMEDLVARFTQATNELQLMGLAKADARKKKGKFAQRLVWATGLSH